MARFGLDEVQAQAILDMQLKRLQGLEKEKLEAEYAELEKRIAKTSFPELVKIMVQHDMKFVKKLYLKEQIGK